MGRQRATQRARQTRRAAGRRWCGVDCYSLELYSTAHYVAVWILDCA